MSGLHSCVKMESSGCPQKVVPYDLIHDARAVLKRYHIGDSPLIPLHYKVPNKKIYLKCENMLPFNSFKVRGACYAIDCLPQDDLKYGVCGASAGNFGQGLGYMAKQIGVPCAMLVPDHVPDSKLNRMLGLDVAIKKVPVADWFEALRSKSIDGLGDSRQRFVHPCDLNVMAGHGTIGAEIAEALPNVDWVVCPYGSGGLVTGVASALKKSCPNAKVVACEPETATSLLESLQEGRPVRCKNYRTSFVDGMGANQVLDDAWPYVHHLVKDSISVSLQQICDAIKLLMDSNCIKAEGAGAASLAAALADDRLEGNVVCIVSGGNIDPKKICCIYQGRIPE